MKSEKPKLAYFTSCYPRASDSFIRTEVKQLRKVGWNVTTFSVRKPSEDHFTDAGIEQEFKNTHYLLERPLTLFSAFFQVLFCSPLKFLTTFSLTLKTGPAGIKARVWQIAYMIEACKLALLLKKHQIGHLHNHIGEASATVAMLASSISGIPFSQTIHGPGIFYHPEKWALGEKIKRSSFTRCISHFCKSQCMAFSEYSFWNKLHVIHCGLDDIFLEFRTQPIQDYPKLIAIGRLEAFKGYHLLIEAAEQLIRQGRSLELSIVGDGPLRQELEKKIKEKGVEKHIKLLGWKSSEWIRNEILQSKALVSSSFNEGIPIVLMEAFALGRPVICPWVAGVPELVVHEKNGYMFPAGSVSELAHAMDKALTANVTHLEEMGQKGREAVLRDFTAKAEMAKLAVLLERY